MSTALPWDHPSPARRGALFLFFPGTDVFSAAYSEPLALCLAAAALLALVQRRLALRVPAGGTAERPRIRKSNPELGGLIPVVAGRGHERQDAAWSGYTAGSSAVVARLVRKRDRGCGPSCRSSSSNRLVRPRSADGGNASRRLTSSRHGGSPAPAVLWPGTASPS